MNNEFKDLMKFGNVSQLELPKWMARQMDCTGWYLKLIYLYFIVQLQQNKDNFLKYAYSWVDINETKLS